MSRLITNKDLKLATGFDSNASIEKCLRSQKIPVLYGKNGVVFTTLDAINSAMGLNTNNQDLPEKIEFFK